MSCPRAATGKPFLPKSWTRWTGGSGFSRAISQFPVPLADLLRSWVASHRNEDITAGLNRFEAAIQADRQEASDLTAR